MSISIADLPFPLSPELLARLDFRQFGLHGVSARCSACGWAWTFGPNALKRIPRNTPPPELAAHVCAEQRS